MGMSPSLAGSASVATLRDHYARMGQVMSANSAKPQTQPSHYGSGARNDSVRRRQASREARRQRDRDAAQSGSVRGTPSGPMESMEWLDALEDVKLRLTSMERMR